MRSIAQLILRSCSWIPLTNIEPHRFHEEFGVEGSEQRGGLCAPQPGGPEPFLRGAVLPSANLFVRHVRSTATNGVTAKHGK